MKMALQKQSPKYLDSEHELRRARKKSIIHSIFRLKFIFEHAYVSTLKYRTLLTHLFEWINILYANRENGSATTFNLIRAYVKMKVHSNRVVKPWNRIVLNDYYYFFYYYFTMLNHAQNGKITCFGCSVLIHCFGWIQWWNYSKINAS